MSILRIEVVGSGKSETFKKKADGSSVTVRKQEAYLHDGHTYPQRFYVGIGKDESGNFKPDYSPGFYSLAAASFRIGAFDALELDPYNIVLARLDEVKPVKAA